MDPFVYREHLTLPKLLIVGTNDPYWVVDSMNLYWHQLKGPKRIRQVPNAGHSLKGGRQGALLTLGAFYRYAATKQAMPLLTWNCSGGEGRLELALQADSTPIAARLWSTQSKSRDFRKCRWEAAELTAVDGKFQGKVRVAEKMHAAVFGELVFEFESIQYSLTTLVYTN